MQILIDAGRFERLADEAERSGRSVAAVIREAMSRDLVSRGHARGRHAVHAATALAAGFTAIVSPDRDFDGIPGLARLAPTALPTEG